MYWRKNMVSYVMWLIYTLFSVATLLIVSESLSDSLPGRLKYGGLFLWLGIFLTVCIVVPVLHRLTMKRRPSGQRGEGSKPLVEAVVAMILLFLGLALRVVMISANGEMAAYFETAKVVEGQSIPQVVHGISYLYLQLLRIIFLFLGNKFIVAVWAQIILQLAAAMLLYVAVKKLSGSFAALFMLGLIMCSDYMVQGALTLSPQMLYLLMFALGLVFLSCCQTGKFKPALYLWTGIWCGLATYLDITGLLFAVLLVAAVLGGREVKLAAKKKCFAVLLALIGIIIGLFGAFTCDAVLSLKSFEGVIRAWWEIYRPRGFNAPVTWGNSQAGWWGLLLAVLMATGIFSFWYERIHDYRSGWILTVCFAGAGSCFGMFTEEVPAVPYLFLFMAILAGISVRDIFRYPAAVPADTENKNEGSETIEDSGAQAAPEKTNPGESVPKKFTPVLPGASAQGAPGAVSPARTAPRYIENPLPLPKPHVKRVMSYDYELTAGQYDFDHFVSDSDDFDI